jgi:membrane-bound lytic murein transglycosylase D
MDHLATSLSAVQNRLEKLEKGRAAAAAKSQPPVDKAVNGTPKAAKAAPKIAYHTVAKGDTLYSVGRKYGLKVDQLLKINHLPADTVIKPGQRLRVTP